MQLKFKQVANFSNKSLYKSRNISNPAQFLKLTREEMQMALTHWKLSFANTVRNKNLNDKEVLVFTRLAESKV